MAAVGTNIAGGDGPAYVICALPYRADVDGGADWGLDTALAIVEEAVDAFDPPRIEARPVRTDWPPELQDKAKVSRFVPSPCGEIVLEGASTVLWGGWTSGAAAAAVPFCA